MKDNNPNTYFLVDVSNIMHRFISVGIKFKGLDTKEKLLAHIDIFANDILKNIFGYRNIMGEDKSFSLKNMVFVFDQASWRQDLMEPGEYKAGRDTSRSETVNILTGRLIEICSNIGITTLKEPRLEADDIIALFIKHHSQNHPDDTCVILSNDDDFSQLLEIPNTHIYNGITNKWNNKEGSLALIQKILLGDDSDSIPRPYQLLEFNNEIVNLTYGPKEILNNINGKFVCDCPNGVTMTLEKTNDLLELYTFANNEKNTIFSSSKSAISFDDNLRLSNEINFKFDKEVAKEDHKRVSNNASVVISQMVHYLQDGKFQPSDKLYEDFASYVVDKYIDKFKTTYQAHLRKIDNELSAKQAREKVAENWIEILFENNSSFFETTPNDFEDVKNKLYTHFMNNVTRNDTLINFDNIPGDFFEMFEKSIYPTIFSKDSKSLKEVSEYLFSQKLYSANKALLNPIATITNTINR